MPFRPILELIFMTSWLQKCAKKENERRDEYHVIYKTRTMFRGSEKREKSRKIEKKKQRQKSLEKEAKRSSFLAKKAKKVKPRKSRKNRQQKSQVLKSILGAVAKKL